MLVACEESQVICKAFRERGHEAFSSDIKDCSGGHPEWHIKGDVLRVLYDGWDLLIGHPPCNKISYAGTQSWNNKGRVYERLAALKFFADLWEAPIPKICLENPKSCASPVIAKYTQEIQPYYFGDSELKTTWLWLKGLPPLKHVKEDTLFDTHTHTPRPEPLSIEPNGKKRYFTDYILRDPAKRAKTFPGIAKAMAEQWG